MSLHLACLELNGGKNAVSESPLHVLSVLAGHLVLLNRKSGWKESSVSKILCLFIPLSGESGGRECPASGVIRKEKQCVQTKSRAMIVDFDTHRGIQCILKYLFMKEFLW